MKKICLKLLAVIILIAFTSELFAKDPLRRSYIINSLNLETDRDPSEQGHGGVEGKIIFDDNFLTKSKKSKKSKSKVNTKGTNDFFSRMKRRDKRWHLVDYRVRRGDNIYTIAKKFKVSNGAIIRINSLRNPSKILPGDILKIPSKRGVYYRIKRGDSLSVIARRFRVSSISISRNNGIRKNRIIAGTKIFIPEASAKNNSKTISSHKVVKLRSVAGVIKPGMKRAHSRKSPRVPKESLTGLQDSPLMNKTIIEGKKRIRKEKKLVLSWPLRGPITSEFGYRRHPFTGKKRFHCGMDIGANVGTKIRASAPGQVIFTGWKGAYGNMIVIAHKNDYITVYAHNSKLLVKLNQFVKRGEVIGLSGKTGAVTGAHLHFEVRKGIVPLNPGRFLRK